MRFDGAAVTSLVQQAAALSAHQAEITRELGSGSRLASLSTDPRAAAASVRLSNQIAQQMSFLSNSQAVQARMQTSDAALGAVVDRLTAAVSLAVQAASDGSSTADRAAFANQLSGIRDSVLGLANSSYDGTYLFSGSGETVPFSRDSSGAINYSGTSDVSRFSAAGNDVQMSLAGTAVFGDGITSIFTKLASAAETLQSGNVLTEDDVTSLRTSLQSVLDQRSLLGASAARLQAASTYTKNMQTNLQAEQTELAATDPVTLATELSAGQTQRSALLSSIALLGKGSLFDYL